MKYVYGDENVGLGGGWILYWQGCCLVAKRIATSHAANARKPCNRYRTNSLVSNSIFLKMVSKI